MDHESRVKNALAAFAERKALAMELAGIPTYTFALSCGHTAESMVLKQSCFCRWCGVRRWVIRQVGKSAEREDKGPSRKLSVREAKELALKASALFEERLRKDREEELVATAGAVPSPEADPPSVNELLREAAEEVHRCNRINYEYFTLRVMEEEES